MKESQYVIEFRELRNKCLDVIKEHYGERCETKDIDDFPELIEPPFPGNDKNSKRCPNCLVYEKFDEFWRALYLDE